MLYSCWFHTGDVWIGGGKKIVEAEATEGCEREIHAIAAQRPLHFTEDTQQLTSSLKEKKSPAADYTPE